MPKKIEKETTVEAEKAAILNKKILQQLAIEREKRGMSLEDVANRMGLIKSSIYRFEKGDYNLTVSKFIEICIIYNVSPESVIEAAKKL